MVDIFGLYIDINENPVNTIPSSWWPFALNRWMKGLSTWMHYFDIRGCRFRICWRAKRTRMEAKEEERWQCRTWTLQSNMSGIESSTSASTTKWCAVLCCFSVFYRICCRLLLRTLPPNVVILHTNITYVLYYICQELAVDCLLVRTGENWARDEGVTCGIAQSMR